MLAQLVPARGLAAGPDASTRATVTTTLWSTTAPAEGADNEAARAHVRAGIAAFSESRWEDALLSFEAAKALRYSPKLDFNIAVLHEKLLERAADVTSRNFHAAQAIAAYRGYVEALPDASDRDDVEARIEALGRPLPVVLETKAGEPELRGAEGVDVGPPEGPVPPTESRSGETAPPGTDAVDDADPVAPAEHAHARPETWNGTGFLHVTPMLGVAPQLLDAGGTEAAGTLLLEIGGGATLGRRDLFAVGGALGGVFGGAAKQDTLGYTSFHLGATVGVSGIVTKTDRLLLDAHVLAALSRQALRTRNDAIATGCSEAGDPNQPVAARLGFRTGARLTLGVLLGERRRHAITWSIYPAVGVYGRGASGGAACDPDTDGFAAAGIDERAVIDIWSGFGYGLRI